MANRIQIRRDTAANWTRVNPILSDGEPGLETDTNKVKYGDGTTAWASLDYASGGGGGGNTLTNDTKTVSLGSDGILTMPPGNETTSGWIQWSHASDDLTNVAGAGFVDYFNAYTGLGLTAPTNTNAEKGIWFGTPADPSSPFQPETSMVFRNDTLYLPKNGYIKSHDINRVGYANLTTVGTSVTIQTNDEYDWVFGADGVLTLPTDGSIDTYSGTGGFKITTDGQIQFASGYSIGGSDTGLGLRMATDRGTILFGNHPEPGTTTHFHIMKQDPYHVDLFLGDDFNYVKLKGFENIPPSQPYGVEIGTNDSNGGSQNIWRFGTDGTLTLPNSATLSSSDIGFSATFPTNGAGQFSVLENSLTVGISSPAWVTAITNNPSGHNWTSDAAGGPYTITGISGPAPGTNVYTLTGTWPSDGGAFPIVISSNNYVAGGITQIVSDNGVQIATTDRTWTFGADGVLTLPNGAKIGPIEFPNGNDFYSTGEDGYSELNWDNTNYTWVDNLGTTISSNGKNWAFGSDGTLNLPDSISEGNAIIQTTSPINIQVNSNSQVWTFGTDGTLTIPGEIKSTVGAGPVVVESNDGINTYTWTFGTDGVLILPGALSGPSGDNNVYVATTGGKQWTFDATGTFNLPNFGSTPNDITDGSVGDLARNGDVLYFKTSTGWKTVSLT